MVRVPLRGLGPGGSVRACAVGSSAAEATRRTSLWGRSWLPWTSARLLWAAFCFFPGTTLGGFRAECVKVPEGSV